MSFGGGRCQPCEAVRFSVHLIGRDTLLQREQSAQQQTVCVYEHVGQGY